MIDRDFKEILTGKEFIPDGQKGSGYMLGEKVRITLER